LRQAIFAGGRIRANISAAEARVEAARANLAAVEQDVIVQTVAAYADVLRTAEVVKLNENQVRVLEQQLRASRDRFEVGDVTRTDVAQSEARLAAARSTLEEVKGIAIVAEQNYERLTGRAPMALAPLPPLPPLPASADEARSIAGTNNPDLVAVRFAERASGQDVLAVKRSRAPTLGVAATGAYTQIDGVGGLNNFSGFTPQIRMTASMPIFTGGLVAAQVRQAQARQSELLEIVSLTERQVTASAVGNWSQFRAAQSVIQSARTQVSANALAAEGVRQENQVGSRDILDVLNAEQELLNARVALVQAERDSYVLAYQLLAAIGRADVALEGAPVSRYDPTVNYQRVKRRGWADFGYDGAPADNRAQNVAPLVGPQ